MKRLIGLILMVLLSTSSQSFEIAFSKEKSSWTKHIAYLSFLNPESHQVIGWPLAELFVVEAPWILQRPSVMISCITVT